MKVRDALHWFTERLQNPPTFVVEDQPTILSPAHYARKTAYKIDPLLAATIKVEQPHNPRGEEERYGDDLWKHRLAGTHGHRAWKPMLAVLILMSGLVFAAPRTAETAPANPVARSTNVGYSDTGYHVMQIQYKLKSFGYSIVVDGKYLSQTKRIVASYQKSNGLTPNGVVDPKTLDALDVVLGSPVAPSRIAPAKPARSIATPPTPDPTADDTPIWSPAPSDTESIIRDVWSGETADIQDWAVKIAHRESGPNLLVTAHNACCYGIFQIHFRAHRVWLANFGVNQPSDLYDPRVAATVALALFHEARNGPWLCHGQCTDIPLP